MLPTIMGQSQRLSILLLLVSSLAFAAATITPPDGNSIDFTVKAKGFQIYSCIDPNNTGYPFWTLRKAEAELYNANSQILVGFHYFLPRPDSGRGRATWSLLWNPGFSSDLPSSTVTGKAIYNSSGGAGNIDNLLVQATSHSGHTQLSKASYIQRLQNRGGVAPSSDLCQVNVTQEVPYESDYVFWTQQEMYIETGDHAADCDDSKSLSSSSQTRPLLVLFGEGFQHYRFNGSVWELFNATALLSSLPGQEVVGEHFFRGGQPTWSTYTSQSSVTAKPEKTVRDATTDSISWVDLRATSNTGDKHGLGTVTYVQRRSTRGGLPPQVSRSLKVGDVFLSPYTSIYWFYVSS